jgi:Protein of unknown function (DUF2914)/Tetratricopeptide repeat
MPHQREPRSVLESAEKAAASGDFVSAERFLREAARLQEASLGPLHPDLANTLNNLGVVCEVAEKPAEAERYFRRAYDIATASLEPDHPFVATSRKNLEDFCAARGLDVVVPVPLPAPVPPPVPSPPPVLARSPAKTIEKKPRLEPRATVRPEPAIHEKAHSGPAQTPSRALIMLAIGGLLSGYLLVTWLGAPWFRSNDAPGSSTPPAAQPPAASPPTTESPKPPETQAANPAETSPAEPKSSEAPKTPVARQSDPATTARATGGVSKSALIVVDANVCKDLQVTGNWRCEPPSRPVAPGRLVFYTRIKSATNAKILHRWYQDDRLRQAVELTIRANPGSGYRTFSRQTVNESGEWRVELRASDGTLLREERFTVR